ncbi:hypothetical protein F5X96DRAFT_663339 [Biscogniauxia mediterranea]|nr:hypothetical protein F5X96DRAFT_663339 [Biscogniauxia mediterranea]
MRIARERGYRVAALTGTPPALGIFRSLGFREVGRVRLYVWRPGGGSSSSNKGLLGGGQEEEEAGRRRRRRRRDDGWVE